MKDEPREPEGGTRASRASGEGTVDWKDKEAMQDEKEQNARRLIDDAVANSPSKEDSQRHRWTEERRRNDEILEKQKRAEFEEEQNISKAEALKTEDAKNQLHHSHDHDNENQSRQIQNKIL